VSCGVGHRLGSDLAWLWLWLAAVAPIGPVAWEPPYAVNVALKKQSINHSINQSIIWDSESPRGGGHSMPLGQGHTGKHLGQSGGRREGRTWTRAFILVFVGRNKRLCGRLTNLTNLTNLNNFS